MEPEWRGLWRTECKDPFCDCHPPSQSLSSGTETSIFPAVAGQCVSCVQYMTLFAKILCDGTHSSQGYCSDKVYTNCMSLWVLRHRCALPSIHVMAHASWCTFGCVQHLASTCKPSAAPSTVSHPVLPGLACLQKARSLALVWKTLLHHVSSCRQSHPAAYESASSSLLYCRPEITQLFCQAHSCPSLPQTSLRVLPADQVNIRRKQRICCRDSTHP